MAVVVFFIYVPVENVGPLWRVPGLHDIFAAYVSTRGRKLHRFSG